MTIKDENTRKFIVQGYSIRGHSLVDVNKIESFLKSGDISYLKDTIYYALANQEFQKEQG